MKPAARERDLTVGPVLEHVRALAVPSALSLLFVTLYNVTDTLYAGQVSTQAQAGLGLGGQLFFAVSALGIGFRIGASAVVGRLVGQGDGDRAAHAAAQTLLASVAVTVAVMAAGWVAGGAVVQWVARGEAYGAAAEEYLRWMLLASPGFVVGYAVAGLQAAAGDAQSLARAQLGAVLANVGLDPLFVFGVPGVWEGLGLRGIAVATVVCQTGVLLYLSITYASSSVAGRWACAHLRPRLDLLRELTAQIGPATGRLLVIVLGGFVVQLWLQPFGEDAVAAYNVGLRLEQLLLLPAIGVSAALLPFVSQNMGAGRPGRVRTAFGWSLGIGAGVMGLGMLVVWTLGDVVVAWFGAGAEAERLALQYLRVETAVFPLFAVLFALQNLLQGLERPLWPLLVGLWRQGVGLALLCWLLVGQLELGPLGVWWSIAAGVGTATLAMAVASVRVLRDEGLDLRPEVVRSVVSSS
jgi:putative MATE family efflux protein